MTKHRTFLDELGQTGINNEVICRGASITRKVCVAWPGSITAQGREKQIVSTNHVTQKIAMRVLRRVSSEIASNSHMSIEITSYDHTTVRMVVD